MRQQEPGRSDPIRPRDWRKILPFEADAASDRLGWVGLDVARYCEPPAGGIGHQLVIHRPHHASELREVQAVERGDCQPRRVELKRVRGDACDQPRLKEDVQLVLAPA